MFSSLPFIYLLLCQYDIIPTTFTSQHTVISEKAYPPIFPPYFLAISILFFLPDESKNRFINFFKFAICYESALQEYTLLARTDISAVVFYYREYTYQKSTPCITLYSSKCILHFKVITIMSNYYC